MQNTIRANRTVTEEELNKIKEMDWDSYYRESLPQEMQGLMNCPNCNAIVVSRDEQSELTCYQCGHLIRPADDTNP
jgi:aspartate carbamoyltransferase regulatory subunit